MPDVMQAQAEDVFVASFRELEKKLARTEPPWLRQAREEAILRFAELGFPTTRQEEWKYTNVSPIAKIPFQPASYEDSVGKDSPSLRDLESALWVDAECSRLVFVNGYFSEALSCLEGLPAGVQAGPLTAALDGADGGSLEEHLGRYADFRHHPFVALNTASWLDGVFVRIAPGTVLEKPIHLVFAASSGGPPVVSHPRTLIIAERDTQATFTESYFGWGEGVCFSNAVTEIRAGENAVIDHYKLQLENERSYHLGTLSVRQDRSANFSSCSISFGGHLARNEVVAVLDAEGADCALNGLYLARGRQHVDNYTTIDHAKPHGTSNQFYKGILDGHSAGVFHGRIIVRKDAQKTDAVQKNKNLLLSEDAVVDTKPQLEIFANDVRCTHGATVGQIDPEALFYLCSRGVGSREARALLTYAFAGDILDRIRLAPFRACLEGSLQARLARNIRETIAAPATKETNLQEAP